MYIEVEGMPSLRSKLKMFRHFPIMNSTPLKGRPDLGRFPVIYGVTLTAMDLTNRDVTRYERIKSLCVLWS